MTSANDEHLTPLWVTSLFWSVIAFGTGAPWLLHFYVGWWAAWISIVLFVTVYDRLFVRKESLCMGAPFTIPLGATMLLLFVQARQLAMWWILPAN